MVKSTNKDWYGIYKEFLVFCTVRKLKRLNLDVPPGYKDLIDPK